MTTTESLAAKRREPSRPASNWTGQESAPKRTGRRVCVVTGARSEYGLLKPVMAALRERGLELQVIATGMHLSREFGDTVAGIERDGFRVDARVDMLFSGDTHGAMAKSIGIGIYGMAQALENLDPEMVVVLGDRVEAFAGAVSAAGLNRLVVHIHGGEVTRGGLDESMRHAITKLAHVHFTATAESRERVLRMGEREDTVFQVGAPGLDSILNTPLLLREELEEQLGFRLSKPLLVAVQHAVSTDADQAADQMRETLEALRAIQAQTVLIYPNSDCGGRRTIEVIDSYRHEPFLHTVTSLDHTTYLSLLRHADALIGNSSSGIIEAPAFHLPVVNIGTRQFGRERSANVIDVPHESEEIRNAIEIALCEPRFRAQVRACTSAYGDGRASERIAEILHSIELGPQLLQKQITY